jgi:hypothetical protein
MFFAAARPLLTLLFSGAVAGTALHAEDAEAARRKLRLSAPKWEQATLAAQIVSPSAPQQNPILKPLQGTNTDQLIPSASLTKLMTAYVVFEALQNGKLHLNKRIPIPEETTSLKDSNFSRLPEGTKDVSVREAIIGMNTQSNNILTYSLAVAVAGSEGKFVETMRKKAAEMGLSHTTFYNSTGLPVKPADSPTGKRLDGMTTVMEISKLAMNLHADFPQYEPLLKEKDVFVNGEQLKVGRSSPTKLDFEGYAGGKSGTLKRCSSAIVVLENPDITLGVLCAKDWKTRNSILGDLLHSAKKLTGPGLNL